MGTLNLCLEMTKTTQKKFLRSDKHVKRKRPKCVIFSAAKKLGKKTTHFGRFLSVGSSNHKNFTCIGLVSSRHKFRVPTCLYLETKKFSQYLRILKLKSAFLQY